MVAVPQTRCRLCHGALAPRFRGLILGRYEIQYLHCAACGSLQTEAPYWLPEAYAGSLGPPDVGAVQRCLGNRAGLWWILRLLRLSGGRLLDFGGGTGLLCRLLRDIGIDAWTSDRHSRAEFAQAFAVDAAQAQPKFYDIVTAFEVLEHLPQPAEQLRDLFALEPAAVIASTELYSPAFGADWWYLAPESGQHVFFYSPEALSQAASTMGYAFFHLGSWCIFTRRPLNPARKRLLSLILRGRTLRLTRMLLELVPTQRHVVADYERAVAAAAATGKIRTIEAARLE